MSRTLRLGPLVATSLLALSSALLPACRSAQVFRLNPGEEPERYRIVCRDSSRLCERRAKEECGGEYTTLHSESNRPEQEEVQDSDMSSTGPSEGYVGWRGELVVVCGRLLPAVRLERREPVPADAMGSAPPPVVSSASTSAAEPVLPRVCVPGVTQACLGPGACSGAQACLADGSGFGVCDCGPAPSPTASSPL
jgi:hypothetical protein